MLHVIGIGARKEHITQEMREVIQECESVFLEYYTCFYEDDFETLSKMLGKELTIADRNLVESQAEEQLLEPAKEKDIALLVLGDPLIATTHTDLLLRAKEKGIQTKIYNNVSIGNVMGRTGLQFYKFGKITSIPFFSEKFMPRTPYLVYIDNHKMGAHTLFLLDLNPSNDIANKGHDKFLTARKALSFLLKLPDLMLKEEEIEEKEASFIGEETDVVVCSRLGMTDERIEFGTIKEMIDRDDVQEFEAPVCLIIPGDLHEIEEEFLAQFKRKQ